MGRKNKRGRSRGGHAQWMDEQEFNFEKFGSQNIHLYESIEFRNESQAEAYDLIKKNTLTFLGGPAGTAKTFLAVAYAVNMLANGRIKKILITRPTETAGKDLGALPGGLKDKMDPFLVPIYDNLEYFLGKEQLKSLLEAEVISICPIQYMRGRTFNDTFVILDESQNAVREHLRLALTRLGENTKCVVTYDEQQIDLKKKEESCVVDIPKFNGRKTIGFYKFENKDIVRSAIVALVLDIYNEQD